MRHFLSALHFLTLLPIGDAPRFDPSRMLPYFPIVGLLLGCLVAAADQLFLHLWSAPVAAALDIILLVMLTGALHLDGLADTADGLYGNRSVDRALAIMKDSRIGTMGAVALICCLGLKLAAIASFSTGRFVTLAVAPAFSRASVLVAVRFLPYGRPQGGTGAAFFHSRPGIRDAWGLLPALGLSFWSGLHGVMITVAFIAVVLAVLIYFRYKLGCITGDMLGALIEITEAALLLAAALSPVRSSLF